MGSKILFNTVFINLEQVVHFLLCTFDIVSSGVTAHTQMMLHVKIVNSR